MNEYTEKGWLAEGERRFGADRKGWKFVCAGCKTVQSAHDFMQHAKDKEAMRKDMLRGIVGFSCIGRYVDGIGCDWTLGGFFQIHTSLIHTDEGKDVPVFDFADATV